MSMRDYGRGVASESPHNEEKRYERVSAVYLFVDESGDFNFSQSGSPYYYFGALTTTNPLPLSDALTQLRCELNRDGLELGRFHASEDRQTVRDRVFATLRAVGGFQFDAVVIEKRKAHPNLYDEVRFYPQFANYLLRYILYRYRDPSQEVVVITDRLPSAKRKKKDVEQAFKGFMRKNLGPRRFSIQHETSAAYPCLQAADYCIWAVHKKWSHGELRPIQAIADFIRSEFDIFRSGSQIYY